MPDDPAKRPTAAPHDPVPHDPTPLPATELPPVESPFFERLLPELALTPEQAAQAEFFHRHGYLVLPEAVPAELVAAARAEAAPLLAPGRLDPRRSGSRFQDAWKESPAAREIAGLPAVVDLLGKLYGRPPVPFQTLTFEHGSEQRAHPDWIHFHTVPPRYLVGAWVALEDVGPDNGTLFYYPGSHRLEDQDFQDLGLRLINYNRPGALEGETYADYDRYEDHVEALMAAHGLERQQLSAPAGTVLLWAAGLVHGGGPIRRPGSTRWSQVTHYFFEDCIYYVPVLSNRLFGDLYLKKIRDVRTGEPVTASYRGMPLPEIPQDGAYKLVLDVAENEAGDVEAGDVEAGDRIRLVPNREIKRLKDENDYLCRVEANLKETKADLETIIDRIVRSPSHRIGRAITAPLRWLKR